jgi:serine/threonine protein kinase
LLNDKYYAVKITPKYNIKSIGRLNSLINEPYILNRFKQQANFVPEIISSFQDYDNMYIITSFYDGPTLGYFEDKTLSEEQIKFISACIIQSLKYIRKYNIIHRDLTILNVIMDKNNYFNLIDFSFSVDYSNRKSNKLKCNSLRIDTPPEIRNNSEYNYNSDYFRLGNLIFFLVFKKYPWDLKKLTNSTEIFQIMKIKQNYSNFLFQFVDGLIQKDIKKRLGYKNINELINHPWFNKFNWKKLKKKEIKSPFDSCEFKINKPICKRFKKRRKFVKSYLSIRKKEYYLKSMKLFEFSKYEIFI